VLAAAGGGQVLVTRMVRDLAAGTDLAFAPSARSLCAACQTSGSYTKPPSSGE
jgi:hypothetical protein